MFCVKLGKQWLISTSGFLPSARAVVFKRESSRTPASTLLTPTSQVRNHPRSVTSRRFFASSRLITSTKPCSFVPSQSETSCSLASRSSLSWSAQKTFEGLAAVGTNVMLLPPANDKKEA